jgi:hypothetical protein
MRSFAIAAGAAMTSSSSRFPVAPPCGADDGDALLVSDRMRHGGFKGRVFFTAGDPAAVRQRWKAGIHTRLEHGACAD